MRSLSDLSPDIIARDVVDSLREGCQVVGFDFRYLYLNDAVLRQVRRSREEMLGRTMMECFRGIDDTAMFAMLRCCMMERAHARMDNQFTYPNGEAGWFDLRFVPVPEGACILSIDITEMKQTMAALQRSEQQQRHMQKMEAVGRLAGSVAHDFNNLLSVILSCAELGLRDVGPTAPVRGDLQEIKKAAERAAALTRQLLAFSHHQSFAPSIVDVNELVRGFESIICRLVREDIQVRFSLSENVGKVKVDPNQLEQVLLNLVVNARDSMPAGGKLVIETRNVELDAAYAARHLGATVGLHAMIAVSDTGVGMDRDTQTRIFEPFFTTKEKGKGSGLGLTTVFGIVRQSGGSVWVYSEPGHGSTFKVYLPVTEEMERQASTASAVVQGGGTETVLVVEDDDQLRSVACGILRRGGYKVIEAHAGDDAILACRRHAGPIHLVLTDVIMPTMSGPELVGQVRALRPEARVLFMSGYTEDAMVSSRVLEAGASLLQKPITPDNLWRAVRIVLDSH
jgi:two-component system, cell cycle sensor histidine kinase and response regulator CckA